MTYVKSAIWITVLAMHAALWLMINPIPGAARRSPDARDHSTFLIVVPIAINHEPIRHRAKTPPMRKQITRQHDDTSRKPGATRPRRSQKSIDGDVSTHVKPLDYEAMARIARAISHESSDRLLPGANRPLSKTERFTATIAEGTHGNCGTAYAGIGLLAIPLLLKDTITGDGCRW
jgi:hypothetical protein